MALLVETALGSEVQGASVTFRWTVQGELLHAEMSAPTTGWVCVGLSDSPGLWGSLLVMGAVRDGQAHVEEHVARPPAHPRRIDLEGRPGLLAFEGEEREGRTTVRWPTATRTTSRTTRRSAPRWPCPGPREPLAGCGGW
jgi:hypothetical protein